MKRLATEEDAACLKIPKMETEEEDFEKRNLGFEVKQEIVDEEYEDFQCTNYEMKKESIDEDFLSREGTSSAPPKIQKSWRPKIESLDDLLMDDWKNAGTDGEEDLGLGKSALFDDTIGTASSSSSSDSVSAKSTKNPKPLWFPPEEEEEDFEGLQNLKWKPNVKSLMSQLVDGETEEKEELQLGSSILFDDKLGEGEDDVREYVPIRVRRQLAPYQLRRAIGKAFLKNRHPSIEEMLDISDEYYIAYKTLFEDYETRRGWDDDVCEPGDTCCRVRSYLERESEPSPNTKNISDESRKLLESEIEAHILSRKRFTLGYVHLIVDRTGLPPELVRYQYSMWRQRLVGRQICKIEDWKREHERKVDDLPFETVKILEEAYLNKKYKSGSDQEWSAEEVKELSAKLKGLYGEKILNWMNKRKNAATGKINVNIEPTGSIPLMSCRNYISPKQKSIMNEAFKMAGDQVPEGETLRILADQVKLTEKSIKNYYIRKQRLDRRGEEWEAARQEVLKLPESTVRLMETLAKAKRMTASERADYAEKFGVSYQTLCSFIDWKKSLQWSKYQSQRDRVMY